MRRGLKMRNGRKRTRSTFMGGVVGKKQIIGGRRKYVGRHTRRRIEILCAGRHNLWVWDPLWLTPTNFAIAVFR